LICCLTKVGISIRQLQVPKKKQQLSRGCVSDYLR
jgi:hypothetical protein